MKITEQSVKFIDSMGSDLSVVNAARVSFHKESEWEQVDGTPFGLAPIKREGAMHNEFGEIRLSEKDQKLIAYLAKHNHWTPFAHAFLSFRIKTPIFVARQLVKHQVGLAWNEVSRRYVDDEPEFWFPKEWRGKPINAKQGSSDVVVTHYHDTDCDMELELKHEVPYLMSAVVQLYNDMIKAGVAPEQARMVLPQNMMTEWIWSGSLAAFARVCRLRLNSHAQQETREVAQMINDQVPKEFEYSWKALLA